MAQMSYEEFTKMQGDQSNGNTSRYGNSPSFFYLTDDGDTAVVRFNIADIKELPVISRHSVYINGKRRNVECQRGFGDPVGACPLCEAGERPAFRVYVKLLNYKIVDGKVVAEPAVWDQPARFRETLKSYFADYGDLRNILFKVTRHGKKGDTNTTYSLIVANPQMYKDVDYPADFSAFENFDLSRVMVLVKSTDELKYYVDHGEFPPTQHPAKEAFTPEQPGNAPVTAIVEGSGFRLAHGFDTEDPIRTSYTPPVRPATQQSQESSTPPQHGPRRYTY